jgi:hypothetical protein
MHDIIYAVRSLLTRAIVIKLRGGYTNEHETFVGAPREMTVDVDKWQLILHDGETPGGIPIAKSSEVQAVKNNLDALDTDYTSFKSATNSTLSNINNDLEELSSSVQQIIDSGGAGGEPLDIIPSKALDSEIQSGSDVLRYVNPKQLKDYVLTQSQNLVNQSISVGSLVQVCVCPTDSELNSAPAYYESANKIVVGYKASKLKNLGEVVSNTELKCVDFRISGITLHGRTTTPPDMDTKPIITVSDFILPNGNYRLLGKSVCEYYKGSPSGTGITGSSYIQPKIYNPLSIVLAQRIS